MIHLILNLKLINHQVIVGTPIRSISLYNLVIPFWKNSLGVGEAGVLGFNKGGDMNIVCLNHMGVNLVYKTKKISLIFQGNTEQEISASFKDFKCK